MRELAEYQKALKDSGLSDSDSNKAVFDESGVEGLQKKADDKQKAIDMGFVDKDGSANIDAYEKAYDVLGDDSLVKNYSNFKGRMESAGYKKQADYIPKLEELTYLDDFQRGQFAMLYANKKPTEESIGKNAYAAYDHDGYRGYYYFKLLQELSTDYPSKNYPNGDGKIDTYDRAQQLAEWFGSGSADFDFYMGLKY